MIIGITGGTGCGKSTALAVLGELGAVTLDCDRIYHRLLQQDKALSAAIAARFPGAVENGELQRKKLGALVFSDEDALEDLNRITHAAVREEVLRRLTPMPKLAAIDAIALFEGGLAELCDVTIAVIAPEEMRIARLTDRDSISPEYAQSRIHAQKDAAWYRERCGYCLENSGTEGEFREKCRTLYQKLGLCAKGL